MHKFWWLIRCWRWSNWRLASNYSTCNFFSTTKLCWSVRLRLKILWSYLIWLIELIIILVISNLSCVHLSNNVITSTIIKVDFIVKRLLCLIFLTEPYTKITCPKICVLDFRWRFSITWNLFITCISFLLSSTRWSISGRNSFSLLTQSNLDLWLTWIRCVSRISLIYAILTLNSLFRSSLTSRILGNSITTISVMILLINHIAWIWLNSACNTKVVVWR